LEQNNLREIKALRWFYNFGQYCNKTLTPAQYAAALLLQKVPVSGVFVEKVCTAKFQITNF
jgi:hypothetical protein